MEGSRHCWHRILLHRLLMVITVCLLFSVQKNESSLLLVTKNVNAFSFTLKHHKQSFQHYIDDVKWTSFRCKKSQSSILLNHKDSFQETTQNHDNEGINSHDTKQLVLVGGGHAHLQVIKEFNKKSRPKYLNVTLIDMQSFATYSGMVPGCIAKLYQSGETQIDLERLTNRSEVNFVKDEVISIDIPREQILLRNHDPIQYDILNIDIGSLTRGARSVKGVKDYAIPTRPISNLISRIEEEEIKLLKGEEKEIHVVLVGCGIAGIELALAIKGRWSQLLKSATSKDKVQVTILNSGEEFLPNESELCRNTLQRILDEKNICIQHGSNVNYIERDFIKLDNGSFIPYSHCIWSTGAEAHPLAYELSSKGIDIDDYGWIRVKPTLQCVSHSNIFAAGDCASIESSDFNVPSKAGVYAVRAGPILIENISRILNRREQDDVLNRKYHDLVQYQPQDDFLKLIMCGDGTAVGFRFGIPIEGKWVWQLKDRIDNMFMDLFRVKDMQDFSEPTPDEEEGRGMYDTSQYDKRTTVNEHMHLSPNDAAILLHRKDDEIDYECAWGALRDMMDDEKYKNEVLQFFQSL